MLRITALTMSAAPERASSRKLTQNQGESPKSAMEAPYTATDQSIAAPWRRRARMVESAAPVSAAPNGCAA